MLFPLSIAKNQRVARTTTSKGDLADKVSELGPFLGEKAEKRPKKANPFRFRGRHLHNARGPNARVCTQ